MTQLVSHVRPRRVLVASADADLADTLHALLLAFGHEPAVAYDLPTADRLGRDFRPDVSVFGPDLPESDRSSATEIRVAADGRAVAVPLPLDPERLRQLVESL